MDDHDFACLALLESADIWKTLPVECSQLSLEEDGLIERVTEGWKLTEMGRMRLEKLRALADVARRKNR